MVVGMLERRQDTSRTLQTLVSDLKRYSTSVNELCAARLKETGLLNYVEEKSTIFTALQWHNLKFIEALLKEGANPNGMISHSVPLIIGPFTGAGHRFVLSDEEIFNYIKLLVKYGADINIKYSVRAPIIDRANYLLPNLPLVDKTLLDMVDEAPLVEVGGPRQALLPRANGPREGVDPRLRPFLIAGGAKHASEMREEWIEQEMDRAREERRRANAEEVERRANAANAVRVAEAAEAADRELKDFGAALRLYCCDGILMPLIEILKDKSGKGLLYGFPTTYTGFKVEGMDDAFLVYGKERYSDQRIGTIRIVGGYAEPTDIVIQFKDPVDGSMKNFNYKTKVVTGGRRSRSRSSSRSRRVRRTQRRKQRKSRSSRK